MPKTAEVTPQNSTPSEPINVSGKQGTALLAAWRGVYHLFGGRVESFQITPDGVVATGFTVNGQYNPQTILDDISRRERRLDATRVIAWVGGAAPEPFTTSSEMTQYAVQFYRGSVEDNSARMPGYLRKGIADFKVASGLKVNRGPKVRSVNLLKIDLAGLMEIINNLPAEEQAKFKAAAAQVQSLA